MKTVKEIYKSVEAWLGIVDEADMPKFLYSPDDLSLALRDEALADELTLHTEVVAGECSCGLALEYTGIPVQAQRGHLFHGQPTSVLLFESLDGFKLQCQECLFDWPVFELQCEHGTRNEAAHCHFCMHAIVKQAAIKGCHRHSQLRRSTGPIKKIVELANPGLAVYLLITATFLLLVGLANVNIVRFDLTAIPKIWQIMAFLGGAFWLVGYYLAESNPEVTAKLKSRAIGTWLWSVFSIFSTAAIREIDLLVAQISSALGFS